MPVQTDDTALEPSTPMGPDDDRDLIERPETIDEPGTLVIVGCGDAKRDPDDEADVHQAAVGPDERYSPPLTVDAEVDGRHRATGPAWYARDLYTSSYFACKRNYADILTEWAEGYDSPGWQVLSAKHRLVRPDQPLPPYDRSIDDLGGDETNPDHHVSNRLGLRRPDGREVVPERDQWARMVAFDLARWLAGFRDEGDQPWTTRARTLVVLAGQDYVDALRDRGVFDYGISRMSGDPNDVHALDVDVRFPFEETDGDNGIFDQMPWLSAATDRLVATATDWDAGTQALLAGDGGMTDAE